MSDTRGAGSPSSARVLAGDEEVRDLLAAAGPRPAPPAEDLTAVRKAAREAWQDAVRRERDRRWMRARGVLALAAALLVAAVIGWWWSVGPPAPPADVATIELSRGVVQADGAAGGAAGTALLAGSVIETAEGSDAGRLALRWSGGQSVRLDSGSRVRLASSRRIELERGALYLDSGRAAPGSAAVEIATALGTVRHIGTQFEVRLDEEAGELLVRVREGRVAVDVAGASHQAEGGEELSLDADGGVERGAIEPYGAAWDWVVAAAPTLEIDGRSLAEFLDWVSEETGRVVRYADAELSRSAAAIVLHGTIDGVTPAEALDLVLPGTGLEHRIENGVLVVSRP